LREVMLGTGRGPGGWLVSTTWMRSPAGIRVKLSSSKMSYRVVRPGTTGCWRPAASAIFRVCFAREEAQWEEALGRMVTVLNSLGQERGVA
jgi:hypothetical protein